LGNAFFHALVRNIPRQPSNNTLNVLGIVVSRFGAMSTRIAVLVTVTRKMRLDLKRRAEATAAQKNDATMHAA